MQLFFPGYVGNHFEEQSNTALEVKAQVSQ